MGDKEQTLINPLSRHDPHLRWFKEARLGLFIHYSVVAGRLGVSEHLQFQKRIPDDEYQRLAMECDIPHFSAAHWVDQAEALGAKYLTLVCKHHDGFCFWDTKTTDFNIMRTKFGRDLVKEVSDECRRRDIRFVIYCSHPDWHDPNYAWLPGMWGDRQWQVPGERQDWDAYSNTFKRQIEELFNEYGPVSGIWYDGSSGNEKRWRGRELYEIVKRINPEAALNDRAGYGDYLSPEMQLDESVDFETYLIEQTLSVATSGWAWDRNSDFRTTPEIVDIIVRMIGCGSNLLLNIGPMGDGLVPDKAVKTLRETGDWVRRNAEAVYGVEGLRLDGLPESLRAARRGDDIYIYLRQPHVSDRLFIPGLPKPPLKARMLGGDDMEVKVRDGNWHIEALPSMPADACAQIIKLSYSSTPICVRPPIPDRVERWVTIRRDTATALPVTKAVLEGFRVKNFKHHIMRLTPPDASFNQSIPELGWMDSRGKHLRRASQVDEAAMWEDEPEDPRYAICDWRGVDQRILFHIDSPCAGRAVISLLLRCPDGFGGSILRIACGASESKAVIKGNQGISACMENAPSWRQGFRTLPFIWEYATDLTITQGRLIMTLQPEDIAYGCYVADIAAVKIEVVDERH